MLPKQKRKAFFLMSSSSNYTVIYYNCTGKHAYYIYDNYYVDKMDGPTGKIHAATTNRQRNKTGCDCMGRSNHVAHSLMQFSGITKYLYYIIGNLGYS